ncbi:ephrin type-B receptor 1-B-like isoform X2 [Pomacea canaliculata]|uniref:ephrin type-B receptor 1-B-like isoform X2 n=1 Tax=Pomacea canaliculata TaxID=400727 RepID=UPI000D736094|nr:ephrin type-B receptor 1-B-like isoform X2 [Pomacea canaliculata]
MCAPSTVAESKIMATRGAHASVCAPAILGFLLLHSVALVNSREVTLLDTTNKQRLGWTTYIAPSVAVPDEPENNGWLEGSFTDPTYSDPQRVLTSCYLKTSRVDNWVRTPFVERGDAKTLHIDIRFSMRKCSRITDPANLQQCKETFNLYYYEADSDFANEMMPTWDSSTYTVIDKVAADFLYEDTKDFRINTESRSVTLRGLRGVYFAFQDEGSCVTLTSIRVYYITCPDITLNFAFFKEVPAGSDHGVEEYEGVCVPNSVEKTPPTYLCQTSGLWYRDSKGECVCMPGYQGNADKTACTSCPQNFYKWSEGTGPCWECPDNSFSNSEGAAQCTCRTGFYRSPQDSKSLPCTRPPSEPRHLIVNAVSSNSVTLDWSPPLDLGGRTDLQYRVVCAECGNDVLYSPGWYGFNTTSVTLTNLKSSSLYHITVYAENGVSNISGAFASAYVTVNTEASAKVIGVRRVSVGPSHITIAWELPPSLVGEVTRFKVRYFPQQKEASAVTVYTVYRNLTVTEFELDTIYFFMVSAQTSKGWGEFSDPIEVATGQQGQYKLEDEVSTPIGIVAGSIVAVLLCMAIATIMIIILLRRNRQNCSEKKECDPPYSHVTMPLFPSPGSVHSSVRTYIDPHTYEDPNQAVREFTREIDACHIIIETVIGGGEFGDVCKGKLRIPGRPEMTVAIKTLKPGATEKNRLDFLTEASIMGQFDDPNVIFLEGVVTKSNPIMIVTEFMANGSLDTFLRANDGKFTVMQLVGMMRGIASGMSYLAEMGYVHRDLAARNILVNEMLVCKVADFGLSREIESDTTDGAYTTKGGKIPVRWTSPEAIAYRKFTSSSDVWSFGVVMWEIMSYGERPYWNWSNQDVIKAVEKGYRLPPPMDCPEALHQLMLDCWQKERSHRPKMLHVVKTLDKLIRAPELLRKLAKPRPHNFIDPNVPDMTQFNTIEDWLASIKMERYIPSFLQAGVVTMEQACHLTVRDLLNIGITLVGHQKKIMNSIQTLRAQLSGAQMSEGFLV